jgi:hypothetical protein
MSLTISHELCQRINATAASLGLPPLKVYKSKLCKPEYELGCGAYGCVYLTEWPAMVVKVTTDATGGEIIEDQYTFDLGSSDATHLAVHEAIVVEKTPLSGIIRVGDTQYVYNSFNPTTKKFLVTSSPLGEADNAPLYVPFLDVLADAATEQSDQIVITGAINVRTDVRKYGFKYYTTDTQIGSAGLSFSPILVVDPQQT